MKSFFYMKSCRHEYLIYLTVWGVLFLAPILTAHVRARYNFYFSFDWGEVFLVWRQLAAYFLLFVLHNFLLVPLVYHKRKIVLYFSVVIILVTAFAICQYNHKPKGEGKRPPMEQRALLSSGAPPEIPQRHPPFPPPHLVDTRNLMSVIMLVFMFGANLGIKGYFRGLNIRARLSELEKQNLEHQLEYLRCQINPHFFMNTLNNIHSLIDVNPEQAQKAIREFAKMMRFILYEENKQDVQLAHELDFVRHYMALMQLRYTDAVRVDAEIPENVPDCRIPPMILITFIENAFKHGISYQHDSFVCVKIMVCENELHFVCRNSKASASNDEKTGIGLVNVRKRLDLLYGCKYNLSITDDEDVYIVELIIPLKNENTLSCD